MGWESGDRLQAGTYEILGIIAKGSFGLIYKAKVLAADRDVVIKTPLEEFKNDPRYQELLKRLQNEAKSLKQLSHPNIVKFWDDFEENDTYCIVLDFIEGETLYSLVKSQEQPLPEAEAVGYIQQIGAALTYMHQNKGKVHRDTHPSNIMVRSDGTAILIDFGLAVDVAIVTPTYLHHGHQNFAPHEQKEGSARPSVDIYTLAAALYFAVTGEVPVSAIDRHQGIEGSRLKFPQEFVPHLSDHINTAILKGMEIKAKDRPKTMALWLELLQGPPIKELDSATNTLQAVFTLIAHTLPWGNPLALQQKTIPWGWLVWSATTYLTIGAILTALTVPRAISAGAIFLAIAWGLAIAGPWAITWLFSLTFIWVISVLVAIGFALASFHITLGWAWVVTAIVGTVLVCLFACDRVEKIFRLLVTAWSKSKEDLLRSFSPAHAFLILAGTNLVSFLLGRFLYNFLR